MAETNPLVVLLARAGVAIVERRADVAARREKITLVDRPKRGGSAA